MKSLSKFFWLIVLCMGITVLAACSPQKEVNSDKTPKEEVSDIKNDEVVEEPQLEEQPFDEPEVEEETESKAEVDTEKTTPSVTTQTTSNKVTTSKQNSRYPYYIKVNRLANCVTIYKQDENGAYTVPFKAMVCSVGNPIYKTPTGVFKTSDRYVWRYLYGNQYGQYATRITGPILFHSVPYYQQKNDTLKTDYYNNLGVGDSMGCIRLNCADAKWIYDNCPRGTTVEIYESSNPGPLGKPTAIKIDLHSPYAGWDPTDPNVNNPWRSQKPTILGVKDIITTCGKSVDFSSHVSAKDWLGNAITVTVTGSVNFEEAGEYMITYSATDSVGNTSQATAVVVVEAANPPSEEVAPPIEGEDQEEQEQADEQQS